jgi:hypothetical protein
MHDGERLEIEILLNRLRQNPSIVADGEQWFDSLGAAKQHVVLQILAHMAIQSGATANDVERAIQLAKLKPTFTPCVVFLRNDMRIACAKALGLPTGEFQRLFRLLLAIYALADERRLLTCGQSCEHWWHENLANEDIVDQIRDRYRRGVL